MLKNIYTHYVQLPDDVIEGDTLECKSLVSDDTQMEPFISEFTRFVKEPMKNNQGEKGERKKPREEGEGGRQIPGGLSLPVVKEIYKDEWEQHSFDEFSALKIASAGNEGGYDYFINMDNKYIQHEIKKRNLENESELIFAKYKYSMVLIGMAVLKDQDLFKDEINIGNGGFDIKWLVQQVTRAFTC